MTAIAQSGDSPAAESDAVWRALANPVRRQLLDSMSGSPKTTGELAQQLPTLSRFAVMQHLGVLTDAGLVVARQRGRYRFNHLNPVPLRRWYERWVVPLADGAAAEMLALERTLAADQQRGGDEMSVQAPVEEIAAPVDGDKFRTVRIETELRFRATPERVWEAITERSLEWFPATYGEERVQSIVLEPRVGGLHYEDWGEGRGHLYGHVTLYDPPFHLALRGRLDPGTILDSEYEISADGDFVVLKSSRTAVGPIGEQQAAGIHRYGDIARFEDALRKVIEG